MFQKTIGILGGMGPVASADTYVELTRLCQRKYKAVQDSDYPKVILYSLPLDEFDHKGFNKQNDPQRQHILKQLTDALALLERAGSNVIVIDCNTVHCFFDELQQSTSVPIINLVSVTVAAIVAAKYKKVGLFCSQTSRDLELYSAPLKHEGIEVISLSQADQDKVNEAILSVMSGHVAFPHIIVIDEMILEMQKQGAECIILGCTEISNLAKHLRHHAILIDSQAIAIEQAIEFAREK